MKVLSSVIVALATGIAQGQAVPGGTLDPLTIPKYVEPLTIPPVLYDDNVDSFGFDIAFSQFTQQVLPMSGCIAAQALNPSVACVGDAFVETPLWGYGNPADLGTFNNPSFTIEVTKDTPTKIKWINGLVDGNGDFLPHILTDANNVPIVDQTLHWAAPNQNCADGNPRTDCRGATDEAYIGPIPMVVHVHGAHVGPGSDGYPESWWLPDAANIPAGFETEGTYYESEPGCAEGQGCAVDLYSNDQPTTTLWYHDHTLGITRLNVYAGGAGFYLIRDGNDGETGLVNGVLPGPPPKKGDDPNGDSAIRNAIREIPIAIQPKSFNADGSQFYPADRAFFEGLGTGQTFADNTDLNIPFLPNPASDIHAVWNPEAFFNTMVVNGKTWPVLEVAQERYRFRLLNAADSRFLNLALYLVNGQGTKIRELPFYQIGAEQSLLPQVVRIEKGFATPLPGDGTDVKPNFPNCLLPNGNPRKNCVVPVPAGNTDQALLMAPAERADVIVDFSGLEDGDRVIMFNTGPDAPFGGFPDVAADPETTGQVMLFQVNGALNNPIGIDPSTPAPSLVLDSNPGGEPKLGPKVATQDLALLEEVSKKICVTIDAVTGVINQVPGVVPIPGADPPSCDEGVPFGPKAAVLGVDGSMGGKVQLWDDPIAQNPGLNDIEVWELWNWSADAHPIHLHLVKFEVVNRQIIGGDVRDPEFSELGWKDTVIAYPGEVTSIKAKFDIPGLYVWHCHILSHEDNEMMVPFCVGGDCPAELF